MPRSVQDLRSSAITASSVRRVYASQGNSHPQGCVGGLDDLQHIAELLATCLPPPKHLRVSQRYRPHRRYGPANARRRGDRETAEIKDEQTRPTSKRTGRQAEAEGFLARAPLLKKCTIPKKHVPCTSDSFSLFAQRRRNTMVARTTPCLLCEDFFFEGGKRTLT